MTVCIAGVFVLGVALALLLPPPIQGYYRSTGATVMDGESIGYLHLDGGVIEMVNFRQTQRATHPIGTYTTQGRSVVVSDQVNSNEFTGTVYLWGIHWEEYGGLDRFTRRAFPE